MKDADNYDGTVGTAVVMMRGTYSHQGMSTEDHYALELLNLTLSLNVSFP